MFDSEKIKSLEVVKLTENNEKNEQNENPNFDKEQVLTLSNHQRDELILSLDEQAQVDGFLKYHPKYSENPEYNPVISYCLKNKLNYEQTYMVLEANWEIIKQRSDSDKIFDVVFYLKEKGLLDSAGIIFEKEVKNSKEEGKNEKKYPVSVSENKEIWSEKLISIAKSKLGMVEGNKELNKMMGFDTKKAPWCAAFANYCLKEAGFKGTGNNLALSFIDLSGYGHVGIKNGNKMISGNWGNKVAISAPMSQIAVGYAIPTEKGLKKIPGTISWDKIPEGAIVAWRRNPKNGLGR